MEPGPKFEKSVVATGPSGNYGQSGGRRLLHKGLDAARRVKLLKVAEE